MSARCCNCRGRLTATEVAHADYATCVDNLMRENARLRAALQRANEAVGWPPVDFETEPKQPSLLAEPQRIELGNSYVPPLASRGHRND